MNETSEYITRGALDILWRQWSTLGAYLTAEKTTSVVMDPEAALVSTCDLGRADPRLFDEVLDWLSLNHKLIRPDRVRSILKNETQETARVVAAAADFTAGVVNGKFLPGIVEDERARLTSREAPGVEDLFRGGAPAAGAGERELDPKFLEWGFRRSRVALRGHSGSPDPNNPANILMLMRAHYGKSARAEILAYLLTGQAGSSYKIARMIGYDQSTVIRNLDALSRGGPVIAEGDGKGKRFLLDKGGLALSLWPPGPEYMPIFFNWAFIFRAFEDAASVCGEIETKGLAEVLRVEALIDLSERIVRLLRSSGEPLQAVAAPDPAKLRQPGGESEIRVFMERVLSIIRDDLAGVSRH